MKILLKEQIRKKKQKYHTKCERMILEEMNCPFIVKLHYAFQTEHRLYFVMDFCKGGELWHHMNKVYKFSEKRSKFYAAELVLAIDFLH